MTKELYISSSPHETKVAVLEDNQVVEVYFQHDTDVGMVGGIYKGRVRRVLPGMQSAFVDIGLERDAFLYVSDFTEDSDEFDKADSGAEIRPARVLNGAGATTSAVQDLTQTPVAGNEDADEEPTSSTTLPTNDNASELETLEARTGVSTTLEPPNTLQAEPEQPDEAVARDTTAAEGPPVVRPPSSERPDLRRFDGRGGRRRRRRGGRFGDRLERSRDQRDRGTHANAPATSIEPAGFELLPGESLAKYGHASPRDLSSDDGGAAIEPSQAFPAPPAAPAPETSPTEEFQHEPLAEEVALQAHLSAQPPALSPADASTAEEMDRPAGHSEAKAVSALVDEEGSKLGASFHFAGHFVDVARPAATESQSPGIPDSALTTDDASSPQQEMAATANEASIEDTAEEGDEDEESEGEVSVSDLNDEREVATEEETDEIAGFAAGEGTETGAGDGDETSEQTYTLRDSNQRPRFAPRRGRRGRRFGRRGPGGFRREVGKPGNTPPVQINEVLKEGQEILVQIAKEPLGTKGARITSHVALPGRHLVYMPTISHIGVSRKIASEEERYRLRNIIAENRGSLTGGFIVRTAAAGCTEEELKADLTFLSTLWNEIRSKAERAKAPALIHRDLTLVQRLLRDILNPDFRAVRVDNEIEYENAVEFISRCQPSLVDHVKLHTRPVPLFEEFGIQAEIDKALRPKIWLKSGGYIVINQTEALVAIDVNTGKFVGKTNRLEDTIVKTNVDAVLEIVRQIRLRDLGGIIVIDFIDMDDRRNRFKVVQALEEALRADRAPTKILSFNEFGLVALTRKRVKQSLERTLCEPCPYCLGGGWVKSATTVCFEVAAEARKMAEQIDGDRMTVRVHPEVAKELKSRQGALITELEASTGKDVIIKSDPAVHQERFEIF